MSVGRLSKNKRPELLLKTFAELARIHSSFELRLVGGDWQGLRSQLQQEAEQLGIADRVFFAGKVSEQELVGEYARASFFVSASQHEGFGISVVEAMACGCVPLVNHIPAFESFIIEQKTGFWVDFSKSVQAANQIQKIRTDNVDVIRQNAVQHAQSFSWKNRINDWVRVYEKLVAQKAGTKKSQNRSNNHSVPI